MAVQFEIAHRPDFSALHLTLQPGQRLVAEPAAMAWKDAHVQLASKARGGALRSLGRMFSGESLLLNTFWTDAGPGRLTLAPGATGDLLHVPLDGSVGLVMQAGAFVAAEESVELRARWEGLRGLFGGEGLVLQHASGRGDVFLHTYGGLLPVDLQDEWLVDTGCLVAFEDTLSYSVEAAPHRKGVKGFLKGMVFGGEALVCRFRGRGRLWVQTRSSWPLARFLNPFRRVRSSNSSSDD